MTFEELPTAVQENVLRALASGSVALPKQHVADAGSVPL
jgi:hypothetical protein